MFLSLEKNSLTKYAIFLGLLIAVGCKNRDSESGLMAANQTVTETVLVNKSIKLKGKGLNENFVEITVDKVGLMRMSASLSTDVAAGFSKPINLAAVSNLTSLFS